MTLRLESKDPAARYVRFVECHDNVLDVIQTDTLNSTDHLNISIAAPIGCSKALIHVAHIAVILHYIKQLTYGV